MLKFRARRFPLTDDEFVLVDVAVCLVDQEPYVVLRHVPGPTQLGVLQANFERVATLFHWELAINGVPASVRGRVRFVYEQPAWDNGKVSFPARLTRVKLELTSRGYRALAWHPLSTEEQQHFNAAQQTA